MHTKPVCFFPNFWTRLQEVGLVVDEVTKDNTACWFHFCWNTRAPPSGHIAVMNLVLWDIRNLVMDLSFLFCCYVLLLHYISEGNTVLFILLYLHDSSGYKLLLRLDFFFLHTNTYAKLIKCNELLKITPAALKLPAFDLEQKQWESRSHVRCLNCCQSLNEEWFPLQTLQMGSFEIWLLKAQRGHIIKYFTRIKD